MTYKDLLENFKLITIDQIKATKKNPYGGDDKDWLVLCNERIRHIRNVRTIAAVIAKANVIVQLADQLRNLISAACYEELPELKDWKREVKELRLQFDRVELS